MFNAAKFSQISAGGVSVDLDAAALIARMSSTPDSTRQGVINNLVVALKTASIWTKFDAFYVFAAHDSQAALLNWVSTSFDATATNSPTFTTDRGFNGNGSSSYIHTNFNPTTASSPKYTQNSAHYSVWRQNSGNANGDFGARTTSAGNYLRVSEIDSPGYFFCQINEPGASAAANPYGSAVGHWIINRSNSSSGQVYKNGSNFTIDLNPIGSSGTIPNSPFSVGAYGSHYSNKIYASASIGSSLNSTEAAAFASAMQTYMTAVGA